MSAHAEADPDPWQVFAEVDVAGMRIGIPAAAIVRALPRPPKLSVLPRSRPEIEGVFRDGEQVVALVNLCSWMAQAPVAAPGAGVGQVMLLRAGARRIGLAVDAVHGLVRLRSSQIQRIHHTACTDEFFHSVGKRDGDGLITLLDPAILVDQVGAWAPGVDGTAAQQTVQARQSAGTPQAVVRIGSVQLAISTSYVAQILDQVEMQQLDLGNAEVMGIVYWRGGMTPVIDPAASILRAAGGAGARYIVILAERNSTLALPVDEVLGVVRIDPERIQSAAETALDPAAYTGTATLADGRHVLLADAGNLLARHGMEDARQRTSPTPGGRDAVPAHIVFDIGHLCATPMAALRRIVPLPERYEALPGLAEGFDGQCEVQGRLLAVVDLRPPGMRARAREACLMVVTRQAGEIGFLVNRVAMLIPANMAERARFSIPGGQATAMITVGKQAQRTSYPVLDLACYG